MDRFRIEGLLNIDVVLVPLDGRPPSRAALPVAESLAKLCGASLQLLTVGDYRLAPERALRELGLSPERLRGSILDQETGAAVDVIAGRAEEQPNTAIVLCTHTGSEKAHGALGSVAEGVLRRTTVPVVLVQPERGSRPWILRRILLPHDGTPTTAAAMEPAGTLGGLAGAEVVVVHVSGLGVPLSEEPGALSTPRYVDQPQYEWPEWASEFLDRMAGLAHPPADVSFRLRATTGEPAAEIVRAAQEEDVDLIVLGWRGHWEAERALTLKQVIHDSGSPVLILRLTERHA